MSDILLLITINTDFAFGVCAGKEIQREKQRKTHNTATENKNTYCIKYYRK